MTSTFVLKKLESRFIVRCENYFDILNHLAMHYECDRQTDGRKNR